MSNQTALGLAGDVASGKTTARMEVETALARIAHRNGELGAVTDVTADRARARAIAVDHAIFQGAIVPPLAGVPFTAKNLFDVAGLTTRAGSKINRTHPPASTDATAISRMEAAGAILVGTCNMDEYAYGFTGENSHDGPSRNPADLTRMTGGSSGGPAASVAGGLVTLALGSDTNGSIRVPASLCGIYGLKPTYGRLSRAGAFPFVASFDVIGPFAHCVADLAAVYDALQGIDDRDRVCQPPDCVPVLPHIDAGIADLELALADDYFITGAAPEALAALEALARGLHVTRRLTLPEAHRARAAALVISGAEGASLHLNALRERAADFDPDTRDRFLAGAMIPAAWVVQAQRFRRWFHDEVMGVFADVDVILALATPISAPKLGQKTFDLNGAAVSVRAHLGLYTQPISFIGLPVVTVPLPRAAGQLPIGVQVIAAPWNEIAALRVAREIERAGLAALPC